MAAEGRIHLLIGPVGAGKSTFLRTLCDDLGAVGFNLDAWMATLFGDDPRPAQGRLDWYVERRDRCIEQIWRVACDVVDSGVDAVLEIGMIQRPDRAAFYRRVADRGYALLVYVLDAPREQRRERVLRRNSDKGDTYAMTVPAELFELASDMWEPPDDDERAAHDMCDVDDVSVPGGSPRWGYPTR